MTDIDLVNTLAIVALSLAAVWAGLIGLLWIGRPEDVDLKEALRLLPDTLRLLRRLAGDPAVPRASRWLLWGLIGYLALPIDLVPDFLPVIGFADDVILVVLVLRRVVHAAGAERVRELWPGTEAGLETLRRAVGFDAGD